MNEDAERARDFEEPAFPGSPPRRSLRKPPVAHPPKARPEPPLSVGTWVGFDDEEEPEDVRRDRPDQMVEAAVPRARGARRVMPGDPSEAAPDDGPADEADQPSRDGEVIAGVAHEIPRAHEIPETPERPEAHEAARAPEPEDEDDEDDEADEEEGHEAGAHDTIWTPAPDPAPWFEPEPWPTPDPEPPAPAHTTTAWPGTSHDSNALAYAQHYLNSTPVADPRPSTELALPRTHRASRAPDPLDELPNELRPARGPFEIAVLLGAPAIALAALLYYFGWARSAAMAEFLGFDEDVLGYTTKEYLLRSVDTLYRPMLAIVAVLLAARMLHPHLLVRLRRHRRAAARLSWVLRCAWFLVPAAVWTAAFRWPGRWPLWWPLLLPCALTAGVLVSAYGVLLSRQLGTHRRATGMGVRPWSLSVVLTASAVVLCLFWTLGAYAQADGRGTALRMVRELPTRTAVVVFSAQDLRVTTDQGVTVDTLAGRDSPYRFRYAGLRLLRRADNRLFLLPDRWSWDRPRLIVVREDPGIRVEYLRAR